MLFHLFTTRSSSPLEERQNLPRGLQSRPDLLLSAELCAGKSLLSASRRDAFFLEGDVIQFLQGDEKSQ